MMGFTIIGDLMQKGSHNLISIKVDNGEIRWLLSDEGATIKEAITNAVAEVKTNPRGRRYSRLAETLLAQNWFVQGRVKYSVYDKGQNAWVDVEPDEVVGDYLWQNGQVNRVDLKIRRASQFVPSTSFSDSGDEPEFTKFLRVLGEGDSLLRPLAFYPIEDEGIELYEALNASLKRARKDPAYERAQSRINGLLSSGEWKKKQFEYRVARDNSTPVSVSPSTKLRDLGQYFIQDDEAGVSELDVYIVRKKNTTVGFE